MFMSKLETQTFQDLLAFTLSSDYIVNLPERELSTMSNFLYNFVVLWFSHLFWWPISSLRNSVTIMARNFEILQSLLEGFETLYPSLLSDIITLSIITKDPWWGGSNIVTTEAIILLFWVSL